MNNGRFDHVNVQRTQGKELRRQQTELLQMLEDAETLEEAKVVIKRLILRSFG